MRTSRRLGKRKILLSLDNVLIEQIDLLLDEFSPDDQMNRSQLIEDILYYVLEDKDLVNEIFPEDFMAKVKEFKEKLLTRFQGKRKSA